MEVSMSLLNKAMEHEMNRRTSREVTQEQRELAIAWAEGKVSITQVAVALGVKTGGVYPFLANALRSVYLNT